MLLLSYLTELEKILVSINYYYGKINTNSLMMKLDKN